MRDLRKLQQRTKCGNNTCVGFIKLFEQHLGAEAVATLPKSFAACDKALKAEAGVKCLELHGCTNCQRHVFAPDDKTSTCCPDCGVGRYTADGRPKERVFFFPIKDRLEKLIWHFADTTKCVNTSLNCLLYTSPSPRDRQKSRMPSSA